MSRLPYYTARYGWRFVLTIYRLAGLADDITLKIVPTSGVSLSTVRAKLFRGRAYITESHDADLARYSQLAAHVCINTYANRIELERHGQFNAMYSDLRPDNFRLTYDLLIPALAKSTSFNLPLPAPLSSPQVAALKEYLSSIPAVKAVQVSPHSILLAR